MKALNKLLAVVTTLAIIVSFPTISYGAITPMEVSTWATMEANKALGYGILPEILEGTDGKKPTTRMEFTHLAVKVYEAMSGKKLSEPDHEPFSDTEDKEIGKAYLLGMINGMGNGEFSPDSQLTREQAVTILARLYTIISGKTIENKMGTSFKDGKQISAYARDSVYFLAKAGVVEGMSDNYFNPKLSLTREQALVIAVRMLDAKCLAMAIKENTKYVYGMTVSTLEEVYDVMNCVKNVLKPNISLKMTKDLYEEVIKKGLPLSLRGIDKVACKYHNLTSLMEMDLTYNNHAMITAYLKNKEELEDEVKSEIMAHNDTIDNILDSIITEAMSLYEKEKAVHDYMVKNYEYDRGVLDAGLCNVGRSYTGLLSNGKGVCSAYAELFDIFMMKIGIPSFIVVGSVKTGGCHMWNMVYLNGNWHMVDVTWDDPVPDRPGRVNHNYFNISGEQLKITHIFNEKDYPFAASGKVN